MNRPVNANDPTGHMLNDGLDGEGGGCDANCLEKLNKKDDNKKQNNIGGVCTQCHTGDQPQIPQDPYSDWNSGTYSGCFMCHAAQAYNQSSLTNSQLAAYNNTLYGYGGYYGAAMIGGAVIGTGIGLGANVLLGGAGACSSNAECTNEVRDASSYANKILLQKSLASEAQVGEVDFTGRLIASGNNIRDVSRLVSTYGGQVDDWAKLSSSRFTAMDQTIFETHWYANQTINMLVEIKTKIIK